MKFHHVLMLLALSLAFLTGCGEDSEESVSLAEDGDVCGTITDKESGVPIKDASVYIGGEVTLTDAEGKYQLEEIRFSDKLDVAVTAANYREYRDTISLDQEFLFLDIMLIPVDSPSAQILRVLDAISRDIGALDPSRIQSIQSHFSRDYVAADNLVTLVGVLAGVVPSDYSKLPDAIMNIVEKYDRLIFKFADPDVELSANSASVRTRFAVYAETKPPKPQKWDIIVNGRLDLREQSGGWKITYWKLVSDFLKFEWEPL
jgi:hypothetical protein